MGRFVPRLAAALALAVVTNAASAAAGENRPLTPAERESLQKALKGYLEPESQDAFKFRIELMKQLGELKKSGADVLRDHDALMSMIYATRPLLAPFDKASVQKGDKDSYVNIDPTTGAVQVKLSEAPTSPARRLSVSLPAGYADLAKNKKLNATPPFPMVVILHDLSPDFEDPKTKVKTQNPGTEAIRRLWDRKATKIPDSWILFAPVAPRAMFVENGQLKVERVPLGEAYQRYHVDFDKIVLDGGSSALAFAVSQPNFYAGLIVRARGTQPLELPCPELLGNLATLRIFVDGPADSSVVAALKGAKLDEKKITVGDDKTLPAWLGDPALKREVPKEFAWTVKDRDAQGFAHWINIDGVDEATETRTLDVKCVRTKDENTVQIQSNGIRTISLFLSDQLLDLDREVKVIVNGVEVKEVNVPAKTPAGKNVKLPAKFERTVDEVFDGQLSSRKWMYYPWLWPVTLRKIQIRTDKPRGDGPPGECPPPTTVTPKDPPAGSRAKEEGDDDAVPDKPEDATLAAEQEKQAATYFDKAEAAEKAGEVDKALRLYRKAMKAGGTASAWSSVFGKAQEAVHRLTE